MGLYLCKFMQKNIRSAHGTEHGGYINNLIGSLDITAMFI